MVNKLFDKKSSGDAVTHARSGPLAAKDYSAIMQDQQLSEKLKNGKYIYLLKTIFRVLILSMCY